jgi:hypothetical protein
MRKFRAICVSLLAVTSVQSASAADLGVLGGLSIATAETGLNSGNSSGGMVTLSSGSITNFTGGVFAANMFGDVFGLETGLFYQTRGFSVTASFLSILSATQTFGVDYFTVPLMARIQVARGLRLGFGGYGSMALSGIKTSGAILGSATVQRDAFSVGSSSSGTRSGKWSDLDFGLIAGIQGLIPMADSVDFVADARYQFGLVDVVEGGGVDSKLRDLSLMAGVMFSL